MRTIRATFTCDGCGETEAGGRENNEELTVLPDGWSTVSAYGATFIGPVAPKEQAERGQLCYGCVSSIRNAIAARRTEAEAAWRAQAGRRR